MNIPYFKAFCLEIGVIPSIFDESLSYWDMMCKLVNFLNTEVILKVNENTKNINDLINFTNDLSNTLGNALLRVGALENNYEKFKQKYDFEIPILRQNLNNLTEKQNTDVEKLTKAISDLKIYTDDRFTEFFSSPQFENALNTAFNEFFTDDKIRQYLNEDLLNGILADVRVRPKNYTLLQDVKNDVSNLVVGMEVHTMFNKLKNDLGGAQYLVIQANPYLEYDDGYYIKLNDNLALQMINVTGTIIDAQYGISPLNDDETNSLQFKRMCKNFRFDKVLLTNEEQVILDTVEIISNKTFKPMFNKTTFKIKVSPAFKMIAETYQELYKFENIDFDFAKVPTTSNLVLFNVQNFDGLKIKNCSFKNYDTTTTISNNNYFTLFDLNKNNYTNKCYIDFINNTIDLKNDGTGDVNISKIFAIPTVTNLTKFNIKNCSFNIDTSTIKIVEYVNKSVLNLTNNKFNITNILSSVNLLDTIVQNSKNNHFKVTPKNTNTVELAIFTSLINSVSDSLFDNNQDIEKVREFKNLLFINVPNDTIINDTYSISNLRCICKSFCNIHGRTSSKFFKFLLKDSYINCLDGMEFTNVIPNCFDIINTTFDMNTVGQTIVYFLNSNVSVNMNNVKFLNMGDISSFTPIDNLTNSELSLNINNCIFNNEIIKGIPTNTVFLETCKIGTMFPSSDTTHLAVRKVSEGNTSANWLEI